MHKPAFGMIGAALLLAGVLGGCAGLGKPLESPRISLANIQVLESKGLETAFLVHLRVMNPNDLELDVIGVDCDLEINGRPFAYGLSRTQTKVPAFGSETIPVTVYSSVVDIIRGLLGLQGREELSYQIKGRVRMAAGGLMPSSLPFDSQGKIAITDMVPAKKGGS